MYIYILYTYTHVYIYIIYIYTCVYICIYNGGSGVKVVLFMCIYFFICCSPLAVLQLPFPFRWPTLGTLCVPLGSPWTISSALVSPGVRNGLPRGASLSSIKSDVQFRANGLQV